EFVLCCARPRIDPQTADRIRALIAGGLNWPDIVATAMQHRVSLAIYETIAATAQDLLTPSQHRLLREAAHSSASNGIALLRELLSLSRKFEAAQIPAIPYKGPML